MAFTNDGLQPFLNSARTKYLLGGMFSQCGKPEEARQNFQSAAGKSDAGEIIWAWFAARQLPAFDQRQWSVRLESALEQVTATSEASGLSGLSAYNSAMLNRALGREHDTEQGFRQVFLLPDNLLSYHLTREALTAQ